MTCVSDDSGVTCVSDDSGVTCVSDEKGRIKSYRGNVIRILCRNRYSARRLAGKWVLQV